MISLQSAASPPGRVEPPPSDDARLRDRLNRTARLLKRLQESLAAGDPTPGLPEILATTGLPHPGTDELARAVPILVAHVEREREALRRRGRLSREIQGLNGLAPVAAPPAPNLAPSAPPAPTLAPAPVVDEGARLARVSARDLDALPYGAILMDDSGRIVAYNDTESRMARLPVEAVIGRNFFTEVAPCTRVKDFEGRFRALAAGQGAGLVSFDFVFPFPFGAQRVSVLLTRHSQPGHVIMALIRR